MKHEMQTDNSTYNQSEFSLTLEKMNEIPYLYCTLKYHDFCH
mgnify:CR=1 FL=1